MKAGVARLVAAAAMAMIGAGPGLSERQTFGLLPGSGIVKRSGPVPRRRESARQAAAQAKRERKNAKRRRDWMHCYSGGATHRAAEWPFASGVTHGK